MLTLPGLGTTLSSEVLEYRRKIEYEFTIAWKREVVKVIVAVFNY